MESMAFDVSVEKAPIIAPEPASPFPNPEPVLLPRLEPDLLACPSHLPSADSTDLVRLSNLGTISRSARPISAIRHLHPLGVLDAGADRCRALCRGAGGGHVPRAGHPRGFRCLAAAQRGRRRVDAVHDVRRQVLLSGPAALRVEGRHGERAVGQRPHEVVRLGGADLVVAAAVVGPEVVPEQGQVTILEVGEL
ncbi:hypothetical protein COLAER_01610 [Collinsella aerofaciens ATCC 25986]|uniref:Uncharacterized protein n=1 Tax=Collinsella aerofaciens (strain ATCC 25986 / DSM 3979 / JCM 10188 / KCTC 3647 / NCTC 11838 / VPI 1003) TaxID=411903 RepID=A4EAZ7_COLAA|nr:hypothetical protein COLAER_01610 [Collinsella aerofaciens ATCC 25986]